MGVVNLKENKQEGRYAVEIVRDLERAKEFKSKMSDAVEKLKADIEEKSKELAPAEQKVISAANEYNAEILVLQDRAVIVEQLKVDLDAKQNLVTGLQAQLSIKQQEKQGIEDALTNPGLTPEQIADLQAQLAIVNDQIADLTDQLNALNADIADTVARIEELEDPKKQLKKVNDLTEKFLSIATERDKIKYEILFLELSKSAKEKRINEYDAILNQVDARDIWCVDYEVTLTPNSSGDNHFVSIEINDDPTHILIAPMTYEPIAEDVTAKELAINNKITEYNDLNTILEKLTDDYDAKLAEANTKLDQLFAERNFITTIDFQLSEAEIKRLLLESKTRENKLEDEYLDLSAEAVRLRSSVLFNQSKQQYLFALIEQMKSEKSAIAAAIASPTGIYLPIVTTKTRRFQPTHSSGPSAVFYNKALLPGYQKWRPTFRTGVVKFIDGDYCTVALDDAISSQKKLNINKDNTLFNVPIKYGSCNGEVFQVGDNIVVEFKDQAQEKPVVIGFQTNPRPCKSVYVTVADYFGVVGDYPDNSIPPYQKQRDRKLISHYKNFEAPKVKPNFYAGGGSYSLPDGGYWYSDNIAISWKKQTVYRGGRYENLSNNIICGCLKKIIFLGNEIQVICLLLSSGFLKFYSYANSESLEDKLELTELISTSVGNFDGASIATVVQANFTKDTNKITVVINVSGVAKIYFITIHDPFLLTKILAKTFPEVDYFGGTNSFSQTFAAESPSPQFNVAWGTETITASGGGAVIAPGFLGTFVTGNTIGDNYLYVYIDFSNLSYSYAHTSTTSRKTNGARPARAHQITSVTNESRSASVELRIGRINLDSLIDDPLHASVASIPWFYNTSSDKNGTSTLSNIGELLTNDLEINNSISQTSLVLKITAFHDNTIAYMYEHTTDTTVIAESHSMAIQTSQATSKNISLHKTHRLFDNGQTITIKDLTTTTSINSSLQIVRETVTPSIGTNDSGSGFVQWPHNLTPENYDHLGYTSAFAENGEFLYFFSSFLSGDSQEVVYGYSPDMLAVQERAPVNLAEMLTINFGVSTLK